MAHMTNAGLDGALRPTGAGPGHSAKRKLEDLARPLGKHYFPQEQAQLKKDTIAIAQYLAQRCSYEDATPTIAVNLDEVVARLGRFVLNPNAVRDHMESIAGQTGVMIQYCDTPTRPIPMRGLRAESKRYGVTR
jgi:hypothetical protein